MTELPERILAGAAGEWERELLQSARLDVPSVEFKRTFPRRLSVALSTASLLVSGTSQALGVSWLKWLAIGFVIGTAGSGAGVELADWTKPDAPAAAPSVKAPIRDTARARAAREAQETSAATAPSAAPMMPIDAAKSLKPARVAALGNLPPGSGVSSRGEAAAPAATPALRAEMTELESIRAALSRGEPRSALQNLDRYDLEYPSGALSIESHVLRIEALAAAGERDAALTLAQRFLGEHPDSPYEKRVTSITRNESRTNR